MILRARLARTAQDRHRRCRMPQVRFISPDGSATDVEGDIGQSVMELAKRGGIEGVDGECGGCCACATCHVLVADDWCERLDPPSADELDMLDFVSDRQPASRLGCQIRLRAGYDGLVVAAPGGADDQHADPVTRNG